MKKRRASDHTSLDTRESSAMVRVSSPARALPSWPSRSRPFTPPLHRGGRGAARRAWGARRAPTRRAGGPCACGRACLSGALSRCRCPSPVSPPRARTPVRPCAQRRERESATRLRRGCPRSLDALAIGRRPPRAPPCPSLPPAPRHPAPRAGSERAPRAAIGAEGEDPAGEGEGSESRTRAATRAGGVGPVFHRRPTTHLSPPPPLPIAVPQDDHHQAQAGPRGQAEPADPAVVPVQDGHQDSLQRQAPPLAPHQAGHLRRESGERHCFFTLLVRVQTQTGAC